MYFPALAVSSNAGNSVTENLEALGAAIALFALVIAYVVARANTRNKQVDIILYHNKQFDELQKKRSEIRIEEALLKINGDASVCSEVRLIIETEIFFDRFWSLQFDGFTAWYDGYIPTRLYTYWLFSRWRELSDPSAEWTLAKQDASDLIGNRAEKMGHEPRSAI